MIYSIRICCKCFLVVFFFTRSYFIRYVHSLKTGWVDHSLGLFTKHAYYNKSISNSTNYLHIFKFILITTVCLLLVILQCARQVGASRNTPIIHNRTNTSSSLIEQKKNYPQLKKKCGDLLTKKTEPSWTTTILWRRSMISNLSHMTGRYRRKIHLTCLLI